ncbi:hypothetical protein BDP27DRAFT_1452742 [Rhodocollybia butyracea]|uniref:Uncharacterized protein n=1 Tax=Rhodocollybia butyracea TaxID=206335 RepID=A0A9P5P8V9_9AGAR|nr:hypothetical protein BDP27DRAFT_1452742 [Rhodocollybia butyracea]
MGLEGSATAQSNQPGAFYSSSQNPPLYASPNPEAVQFLLNHHIPQHDNSLPQLPNVYAPLPSAVPAFPAPIFAPQHQRQNPIVRSLNNHSIDAFSIYALALIPSPILFTSIIAVLAASH